MTSRWRKLHKWDETGSIWIWCILAESWRSRHYNSNTVLCLIFILDYEIAFFLLWSRWRKWYLIIRLLSPFYFSTKRKEKSALAILIICECLPGRLLQCQQFFLSFSEPRTEILGDQELFVDYASSLNLTCLVISPNPPAFVFWKLSEKVSNKIKVYGH